MGQTSGEPLNIEGHNIEGHNIEGKVHCTVSELHETWLKTSLAIDHYVKVQQLDDICETRR